jgi:hypothetical protein
MLIWILALVLLGSCGFVGFSLGILRTGISLIGLILGALLAWPLGHLVNPVLGLTGLKNPIIIWFLGPFVVFCIILIAFKAIGMLVHHKVDVYYKYKAGDLRMGLWNRLNARLGLCAGLANGAVYLILISAVIYVFSYATAQIAADDSASWMVKLLNTVGKNVEDTGMNKVAAAIDPLPDSYYQTVDIIGMIYHNDLLEGRLSRYPAFLAMGERSEFQEIGKDKAFTEMRQRQAPFSEILNDPKAQNIVNNPDMLKDIWAIAQPNLSDLQNYLKTGKSEKYGDEPIVGRWNFSVARALFMFKQAKPNVGSVEMARVRHMVELVFSKTTLVAAPAPDKQAFLKNLGKPKAPANPKMLPTAVDLETFQGHWDGAAGKYELSFPDRKRKLEAVIEDDRMTIIGDIYPMTFEREY